MKLYKDRYLIALYDKNDYLIDVGAEPKELNFFRSRVSSFYEQVSRGDKRYRGCKMFFIDCKEKHEDVFKEEDELFLEEIENSKKGKDEKLKEIAKKLGISKRTAYRWVKNGKIKGF